MTDAVDAKPMTVAKMSQRLTKRGGSFSTAATLPETSLRAEGYLSDPHRKKFEG
jgi:hypothetical protein